MIQELAGLKPSLITLLNNCTYSNPLTKCARNAHFVLYVSMRTIKDRAAPSTPHLDFGMLQALQSPGYWPSSGKPARYVLSNNDAVLVINMHPFNSPMAVVSNPRCLTTGTFATDDGTYMMQFHIVIFKALTRHCTSVYPQLYCVAGITYKVQSAHGVGGMLPDAKRSDRGGASAFAGTHSPAVPQRAWLQHDIANCH